MEKSNLRPLRTPWDPTNCPYYRGVLISEDWYIILYIINIAMGPQLTVLIIEVSLFQRYIILYIIYYNSKFDCISQQHIR